MRLYQTKTGWPFLEVAAVRLACTIELQVNTLSAVSLWCFFSSLSEECKLNSWSLVFIDVVRSGLAALALQCPI